MPFYVGDYLRDTMHLTTEEHGAYLLLIMALWNADGSLPESALAATARVTPRRWATLRKAMSPFFQIEGETWSHRRVNRELGTAAEKSTKAKESARTRWGHAKADANAHATGDANAHANADADAMRRQCSSQSPSPTKEENQKQSAPAGGSPDLSDLSTQLYARGRAVLGKSAGGLVKQLLDSQAGNVAKARAVLETASTKADPRAYVGAVIRNVEPPDGEAQTRWAI